MPDKDTILIWYCLAALGVVTSFTLARFAKVPFVYSIWVTVPAFLAVGLLMFRWWMKSIDKKVAKAKTPLQVRNVAGIGEMKQMPDYWAVELEVAEEKGTTAKVHITIAADSHGPTERQLALARALKEKYAGLKPVLLERLRAYFDGSECNNVLEKVDLQEACYDICPENNEVDLEVVFPDKDGSDMVYVLCLKDWQIVDVYGAD